MADAPQTTLRDAAKALSREYPYRGRSMIGLNEADGTIRAYLYGDDWNMHDLPLDWLGWPVIWRKGHGPAVAA